MNIFHLGVQREISYMKFCKKKKKKKTKTT